MNRANAFFTNKNESCRIIFLAALVIAELENLQATWKQSCKWMHTRIKLLAIFLQVFRFTCNNLASLSIHLQDFCELLDSSCKITCKMNRKSCKINRKACTILASFSIQMLGKGANAEKMQNFAAFLTALKTRAVALLCSIWSAPGLATKEKNKDPK